MGLGEGQLLHLVFAACSSFSHPSQSQAAESEMGCAV